MQFLLNERSKAVRARSGARRFRCDPRQALEFLSPCPRHAPTPMIDCASLARRIGVHGVWSKDETRRMGLGSFKALGGIYAVARVVRDAAESRLGRSASPPELLEPHVRELSADIRFVTASAGNHGLSVATGARIFGAQATIVLSHAVPADFENRLNRVPCTVVRHGDTYEESVAFAVEAAREPGRILLADGSWEGYVELPAMVMEGYSVIADECMRRFADLGTWPTHVFLQAGVGGLAASFAAHVREFWPVQPVVIVVEPEAAPCLMEGVRHGGLTTVEGPVSVMGRLDCKVASLIALEALTDDADAFVAISDRESESGVSSARTAGLFTTESGAAGLAALLPAFADTDFSSRIGLDASSRCLAVISEGV
ncbi:MAG: diaminopropionate ammonia-lyase [Gammaproteobacteria bacterium]|nr:diaminopropionate ammonia-lyase [Gammaproteobacteria bacterium]MYD75248.1 diaminopropionate ammonia-lyase [Gammaproteobacteria bacterium]MYJ51443.1 diaminopropionate ammonia-lyase [Gammaproteobacteria bacterium]